MSNRAISTELIELGERIRKRRQEMKLSQESFAEKAGISVNTVSRIEGGQTAMSVEIFRKMIEILETDANILITGITVILSYFGHKYFSFRRSSS